MGRELRKVPANWKHPKKSNGDYKPMHKEYYGDVMAEWIKQHNEWEAGTHPDLIRDPGRKEGFPFFAMWDGEPPNVEYYQTKKYSLEELTHIQLYENTSEGTPISPVFRADELDQLCEWAAENASVFADHKATKEQWKQMLDKGIVHLTIGNTTFI